MLLYRNDRDKLTLWVIYLALAFPVVVDFPSLLKETPSPSLSLVHVPGSQGSGSL